MSESVFELPELQGMMQAGMTEEEIVALVQHPRAAGFILERIDDIDTMAEPEMQEFLRQTQAGEEIELVDITPRD